MLIRCAWCKGILGDKPPYGGQNDTDITDGICRDCLESHFPSVAGRVLATFNNPKILDEKQRLRMFEYLMDDVDELLAKVEIALDAVKGKPADEG